MSKKNKTNIAIKNGKNKKFINSLKSLPNETHYYVYTLKDLNETLRYEVCMHTYMDTYLHTYIDT